jgi:cellulose synthase (UDP-forming)
MTSTPNSTPNRPNVKPPTKSARIVSGFVDFIPNLFDRVFRRFGKGQLVFIMGLLALLSIPLIVTPLSVQQQGIIAFFLIAIAWGVTEVEQRQASSNTSEYLHLFLVWLSLITTFRYLYYRTNFTLNLTGGWLDAFFSIILYLAELYAILTMALSFFQTLRLKDRTSIDVSSIPEAQLPTIDVYIPTYNEEVEIVRKTTLGAVAIEYAKKNIYILDDGRPEKYEVTDPRYNEFRERRDELQQMCVELGCHLMVREDNSHAKAGNINTALRKTPGDLVLILDCDHIPTRTILKETVGFFLNPKVSLVQTPHWFYNPDPFERNLQTGGTIPVGNELFYKVLQKGNDFWNAAFFCGSAAIVRKTHLLEVGGIAVETVTEDCHTALRLHALGYESVYYDKIMVAGLAPEKFSAYVGQQVRWARGMAQILRIENPLFNSKLKLTIPQRICYFSATSHFFFGFPRLMYAIAPSLFLVFGINPIRGLGLETLAYALPHIAIATYANFITYKHVRFSFWNEIYEFAMSFHAGVVTFMALVNPKLGSFNVTDKGMSVTKRSFDWESSKGLVFAGALVMASILAVPFWLIFRPEASEAVLVNLAWSFFNFVLIVASILVAFEQPQLRRSHRLDRKLGAVIYSQDDTLKGNTMNVSETGCQVILESWANLLDEVEIELIGDFGARAFLKSRVVRAVPLNDDQLVVTLDFIAPSRAQIDALTVVIYSDVREWYSQHRENQDDPLSSIKFITTSLSRAFRSRNPEFNKMQLRKPITAYAQLYWKGSFYRASAIEIGNRSLRLELQPGDLTEVDELRQTQPLVGLLLSQDISEASPKRLLAQVNQVETSASNLVMIELEFPEQIMQRQENKIRQLVKHLN